MKNYRRAFLLLTVSVTLWAGFHIYLGVIRFDEYGLKPIAYLGSALILCWVMWFLLKMGIKWAFWVSLIMVSLPWWWLLDPTWRRVVFVIENGGMERADGVGSPLAFLIEAVREQMLFLPLTAVLIFGVIAIFQQKHTNKEACA